MDDALQLSLRKAAALVAAGGVRSRDLVEQAIEAIEAKTQSRACFIRFDKEEALRRASSLDTLKTPSGSLHGIPLAHKDIFSCPGKIASFASHPDFHLEGSDMARALTALGDAGSVNLGGLHMSEFAMGPAGWSSVYGFLENPNDPNRVTGGSSSGSAAAVAQHLIYGALGTDTGGSIRIPAAFCNVVGLKPSFGLVPTRGCFPVSQSLDTIGPIARDVGDCARLLDALVNLPVETAHEASLTKTRWIRFGAIDLNSLPTPPDADVADAFARSIALMSNAGLDVRSVQFYGLAELNALASIVFLTEAGAEHAIHLQNKRDKIGSQVAERLLQGLSYPGSLYVRALKARNQHLAAVRQRLFSQIDVLLLPTCPSLPPRRDIYAAMPDTGAILNFNARLGAYTPAFSYLGMPALSMPVPSISILGFGLQLVADHPQDTLLLQAANVVEAIATS